MSRIGVDGRELVPGTRTGIGRFLREVLRAGTACEDVELVVYAGEGRPIERLDPRVAVRVLGHRPTPWWDQVTLPRQLARDRIAVFLSPYYKGPLLAPCPIVLTVHDLFFIRYPARSRPGYEAAMTRLARLYARRATAIITDSEYSKRSIVARLGVPAEKITVIPVALGGEFEPTPLTDAVRRRYRISGPYLFYVGNFKPHKNLPRLLRAYAGLPEALRADHQLVLAGGDGTAARPLADLARALGVADRVGLPGFIDDADLPALYTGCELFVLPSLVEGFGLPALEAMACGTPVAAANRGAIPEVAGAAAILFEPEDVAGITAAMAGVLSDPAIREDMRRRGLARAREFPPERTAGRVLTLLRQLSRSPGRDAQSPAHFSL
ncbi:MAG: glycosyltransferase family 4 protein [Candidatus Rokubacteria bacterium]|nr:glycosyltransferase family 4 protein [Candidatus Rokubacteria bacterium]